MGKVKAVPLHSPQPIVPAGSNQAELIHAINTYSQVLVVGPPGTGKSYITVGKAADWFAESKYNQIFICRPMVSNGDDMGWLPGDELEKVQPWAERPLQIIRERIGNNKFECDLSQGRIQVKPLQMMQGYSLDNCWLIVDEAQEMTISQAKMVVTRMGKNSKLLLNGDIQQCNLKEGSGLKFLIDTIRANNMNIPIIEFDIDDCQRSNECKEWIKVLY